MKILRILLVLACFYQQLQSQTFTNPLLPSGADPWCIYKDGYYYYTNTLGNRIDIWKTKSIASLPNAERKTVWKPPATGPYSKEIWAPEIHFLKGKWYIYFAADSGRNEGHRLWVLENDSADPLQGEWKMKGKLKTPGDKWSIDGSVFEHKKTMYLIWSGWEGDTDGQQNIYISKMKNPWTVENKRALISAPTYTWERSGDIKRGGELIHVYVNEGPEVLVHDNRLFLIYSASGCWTDNYTLGMLEGSGKDLLNPSAWKKHPEPVFVKSPERKVYAPGHNCFFKSPDGKEDWILYHANSEPAQGCGRFRSPRAQKFTWTADGLPYFGEPVAEKVPVVIPSETTSGREVSQSGIPANPVLDKDFPDPTVIKAADGKYYAYATQGNANGNRNNIQVATSADSYNWLLLADALPVKPGWANTTQDFWAPHVLYDKKLGKYVMFYSAESNDTTTGKCLAVAFSDKPSGPFADMGTPLLCGKGFINIDPMAIVDPVSGKKLLYWGSDFQPIHVRELADDWKSFKPGTEAKPVVWPGREQQYSNLIEGAWVDIHNGKYYLYYSGDNCCGEKANYAVMVARSDNALGPFVRLGEANGSGNSAILEKDDTWLAPGHNSIFTGADGNSFIAYHAIWHDKDKAGPASGRSNYLKRVMCINRIAYKNDWPVVVK